MNHMCFRRHALAMLCLCALGGTSVIGVAAAGPSPDDRADALAPQPASDSERCLSSASDPGASNELDRSDLTDDRVISKTAGGDDSSLSLLPDDPSRAAESGPVTSSPSEQASAAPLGCGINLAAVQYYTREWVFTDVFKIAMPWLTQNDHYVGDGSDAWSTGQISRITFDQNGYPLSLPVTVPGRAAPQIVVSLMYRGSQGHYPGGLYTCLYDGQGAIAFSYDASVVSQTQTATGGRMVVRVTPSDTGILLKIMASNPANHIRNIRLIMPGFESVYTTQQFHPLYLDRLRPFKVLRFMDWMHTNNSTATDWAGRPTGTWYTQGDDRGVSVETMVALANASGIDPWFCMPHQATDDYIRQFATLVKATLNPARKVYLEYSNETWNGQFQQYQWIASHGDPSLAYPSQKYAALSGHVFDIWRQVFGASSGRIVRLCMGQHLNPWILETAMAQLNGNVDAAGCAAYFGPATPTTPYSAATTADDLIPLCRQWIRDKALPGLRGNKTIADRWNAAFITYEGGQHITAYGSQNLPELPALLNVQYHPLMYDCYMDLARGLRDMGCQIFTVYNFASARDAWGAWGHLEFQDQDPATTPKYRALLDIAAGHISPAPPGTADLDGDGSVGVEDLAVLLGYWGRSGPADLDGNGVVGSSDLALLFASWTPGS